MHHFTPTTARAVIALGALLSGACSAIDGLLSTSDGLAIQKFVAVPQQISPGGTAILSWDVADAETVEIDNGIGRVPAKGSRELRPERTTTFTLRAQGGTSEATSSVQLRVVGTTATPSPMPFPSPSPSVLPTPSPTPTPAPTPAPTPTPSPTSQGCSLPPMPECGGPEGPKGVWGCCKEEPTQVFDAIVEEAIAKIRTERPDLFDAGRVRNPDAYVQGVARILERDYGVCAKQGGPEDEIGVKNANGFNEQYDILLGSGYIRYGGYAVTCRPARF
jgi:hypothetical protein